MKYDFYRCASSGCGCLITAKQIEKEGNCKCCGGRKMRVAYNRIPWFKKEFPFISLIGINLPKIWEIPLALLGLR